VPTDIETSSIAFFNRSKYYFPTDATSSALIALRSNYGQATYTWSDGTQLDQTLAPFYSHSPSKSNGYACTLYYTLIFTHSGNAVAYKDTFANIDLVNSIAMPMCQENKTHW